ncbi:MAG: hypothetical protein S4CHLAM7_08680 [Chlamydiae bacterium]|nr:hypothetical protein [Chlamydiota bacterium]
MLKLFFRIVFLSVCLKTVCFSPLNAQSENKELLEPSQDAWLSKNETKSKGRDYSKDITHIQTSKLQQLNTGLFFQGNIGLGLLYFDGVKANFTTVPNVIANFSSGPAAIEGKLSYNRTPLYEYLLGYRFNNWCKAAISYQFQGGVTLQTKPRLNSSFNSNVTGRAILNIFKANLSINAVMAKFYLEYPSSIPWKCISCNPYLGIGVGSAWQSWTNLQIARIQPVARTQVVEESFNQKICANLAFMIDAGFRFQCARVERNFFILAGMKYNWWGQARNMGKLSQQGSTKLGFASPFRIKTVYSFAPYIGAQWNFPETALPKSMRKIKPWTNRSIRSAFINLSELKEVKSVWTGYSVGVGFLYFNQVSGSLSSRPKDPINNLASNVPYKEGGISYNRTPLYEFLVGFKLKPWLSACLSYQHQSDISLTTKPEYYINVNALAGLANSNTYAQLKSNLILDSVMGKVYFELPYASLVNKFLINPFLAVGLGPGWQTWKQVNVWRYTNKPTLTITSAAQPLSAKVLANLVWMADLGLRLQSIYPQNSFSIFVGCKYNQWGQARNIGKISQQNYRCYGLFPPFKIKTIYSFAPYLSVNWAFPTKNKGQTIHCIGGRNPNTWKPYFASLRDVQGKQSLWFEYSLGLGLLYFHHVTGNLAQIPSIHSAGYTNIPPMKNKLSYNRTPLFEYMLGYSFNSMFKFCLSYQSQRNMTVSSDFYRPALASQINNAVQFQANLELDSVMLKVYFELPKAFIFKNLASNFYIGAAGGGGWQSWTGMEYRLVASGARNAQYYSEKICANVSFMGDIGVKVQSVASNGAFAITKGIKYMHWGPARNLGKLTQQGSLKTGLFKPVRVQLIYSFIPYLGVQWNF